MADKYVIEVEPDLRSVVKKFNTLWRSYVITIFCHCDVIYEGRAKSYLEWGDRLVISKPDGTLLVHGKVKREPINWQPPGSFSYATINEEHLEIRSIRRRPKEYLLIRTPHVYSFVAMRMDLSVFRLWASEGDMIKSVKENPSLIEEGFRIIGTEVKTPHGKIDLLGRDIMGNIVVCEFKRAVAQLEAVSQLKRYVDYFIKNGYSNVRGILIAPHITPSAGKLLEEYGLEYKRLLPPKELGKRPNIEWLR
ncbi:MAG: endonuclease NucS [Candidatus Njordarchaeales archaeon]